MEAAWVVSGKEWVEVLLALVWSGAVIYIHG